MKKYLAATACVLPFALFSTAYAHGTKDAPGAEHSTHQSADQGNQAESPTGTHTDSTDKNNTTRSTETNSTADSPTKAPTPGNQGGTSSVAPQEAATPRTTEPGAGKNRASSGNSAGSDERRQDTQGLR